MSDSIAPGTLVEGSDGEVWTVHGFSDTVDQTPRGPDRLGILKRTHETENAISVWLSEIGPRGVYRPVQAPVAPELMSDERLAEIERAIANGVAIGPFGIQLMVLNPQMISELLAEVKRLKRENHLLHLSRGSSLDVGQP